MLLFQRCYVTAAVLDNHVYAIGGYDGRWRMRSTERYNPEFNQWTKLADMNNRRSDAGADSLAGRCILLNIIRPWSIELMTRQSVCR